MRPKISVVIACYNEEERIGKCLESLLEQSALPHEIIVVDGGSKDGTVGVVESFIEKDSRISLLKETGKDRSPANARNIGWKSASGDYILFLDADGKFEKDFIDIVEDSILGKDTDKRLELRHSVIDSWKEVFSKYFWYGRTMMKYWVKNKSDIQVLARAILSIGIIILPFLCWNLYMSWILFAEIVFIFALGLKEGVQAYKMSGMASLVATMPIYIGFMFVSTGLGLLSAPFLYAAGKYKTGR